MDEKINADWRRFLRAATMTIAGARFGAMDSRIAQSSHTKTSPPTTGAPDSSFGVLKQIDAGVLNVGYVEVPPAVVPWFFSMVASGAPLSCVLVIRPGSAAQRRRHESH
jgi:hypothetical protein